MPPSCSQSQALIDGGQKQYTDLVLLVRVFNVFLLVLYHVLLLEHKYCRVILIRILLILIEIQCTLPPKSSMFCSTRLAEEHLLPQPHPTPHSTLPVFFYIFSFSRTYLNRREFIMVSCVRAAQTGDSASKGISYELQASSHRPRR